MYSYLSCLLTQLLYEGEMQLNIYKNFVQKGGAQPSCSK